MKMSQVRDHGLDVCLADAVDTANQAESWVRSDHRP